LYVEQVEVSRPWESHTRLERSIKIVHPSRSIKITVQ